MGIFDRGATLNRASLLTAGQLAVFYGAANQNHAHVYVRAALEGDRSAMQLRGFVRGPMNRYTRTLPATFPLQDRGAGPTLLASAILTEPCSWTPAIPSQYQVDVQLCHEGIAVGSAQRFLGIRPFGCRGRNFYMEGKRWVLRAVDRRAMIGTTGMDVWHETATSMLAADPDDALCREASECGVLLVACIRGDRPHVERQLRRLAQWPAVAIIVVRCTEPLDEKLRGDAPNVQLAQFVEPGDSFQPARWAHLLFCEFDSPEAMALRSRCWELPLVAVRGIEPANTVTEARSHCDQLQCDLAPAGDFAGYVVRSRVD